MSISIKRKFVKASGFAIMAFFVLSACGGGNEKAVIDTTNTSSTSTTVTSTTAPVAVTSTVEEVQVASTTTINPEEWIGPRHPLTGLPAEEGIIPRPALAVKIGNNDTNSLPHEGLLEADVVYEALIEAGKTRFLGVYQSSLPERVAPVRSARSTDISLIAVSYTHLTLPTIYYV